MGTQVDQFPMVAFSSAPKVSLATLDGILRTTRFIAAAKKAEKRNLAVQRKISHRLAANVPKTAHPPPVGSHPFDHC